MMEERTKYDVRCTMLKTSHAIKLIENIVNGETHYIGQARHVN